MGWARRFVENVLKYAPGYGMSLERNKENQE